MRGTIIVFILLTIFIRTHAQDGLAPCTPAQASSAIVTLEDNRFAENLTAAEAGESVEEFANGFLLLRNSYLFDIAPNLPDCYEAQMFNLAMGTYIYNLSLESSIIRLEDSEAMTGIEDRLRIIDEYKSIAASWLRELIALSDGNADSDSEGSIDTANTFTPANVPTQRPVQPTAAPTQAPSSREPANCDEARAMGLSAEQAGRYSHLDRDGDGRACYGD